jgi:nitrate/TMAO reductase-like tetraheme cytochrome c subunit
MRKMQASLEVWGHLTGKIDTKEKFEKHRYEMAVNEWTRMKKNDSQECRNCHTRRDGAREAEREGARAHAKAKARARPASTATSASRTTSPTARAAGAEDREIREAMHQAWTLVRPASRGGRSSRRAARARTAERKDLVLNGDAQCTRCHERGRRLPVLAIGKTKHGTVADGRTPTCTSCHGESESARQRRPTPRTRPSPTAPSARLEDADEPAQRRCLTCHQGASACDWQMSAHANRDVAAASCHQVHSRTTRCATSGRRPTPASPATRSSARRSTGRCTTRSSRARCRARPATTCTAARRSSWCATRQRDLLHLPHGEARAVRAQPSAGAGRLRHLPSAARHDDREPAQAAPPFLCQECHSHAAIRARPARCRTAARRALGCWARWRGLH